jgi:hypothetical protein
MLFKERAITAMRKRSKPFRDPVVFRAVAPSSGPFTGRVSRAANLSNPRPPRHYSGKMKDETAGTEREPRKSLHHSEPERSLACPTRPPASNEPSRKLLKTCQHRDCRPHGNPGEGAGSGSGKPRTLRSERNLHARSPNGTLHPDPRLLPQISTATGWPSEPAPEPEPEPGL